MLVPGERLEKADLERILQYLADGLQVQGISVKEGRPGLMVLSEQT